MRWIDHRPHCVPPMAGVMGIVPTPHAVAIVEMEDQYPVAGVIFDEYNGQAIHTHLWVAPGRAPSRSFWFAVFDYAFRQCEVQTAVATVASSNKKAQRITERVGHKLIATVPNYYPNGDDMLLYVCTPESAFDWQSLEPKNGIRLPIAA